MEMKEVDFKSKEKICGIYCIKNIVNKKCYVGQSVDIITRLKAHINNSGNRDYFIYKAINEYGLDNFKFIILETCDMESLDEREIFYINQFNSHINGYNMTLGGKGVSSNELSEIRERQSIGRTRDAVLQFDLNGNILNKFRNSRFASNYISDTDVSECIRDCCNKKRIGAITTCGYIWMYEKDYKQNGINLEDYEKNKSQKKKVYQYNLNGNFIQEFKSCHDANEKLGYDYRCISRVCLGQRKHAYGYIWSYKKLEIK